MSPAVSQDPPAPPAAIPDPPPPPPLPHIITTPPAITTGSSSSPATPTVGSPKASLKLPDPGPVRKQHSFSSLLQKFATDHHFAMDWLEHDDDCSSIVSVDSVASVGSSLSGNLSRAGSFVDVRDAASASAGATSATTSPPKAGLTTASVEKLEKKMEGMKFEPGRKKLSQAMIWTWLTSTKQNALPEDSEVHVLPKSPELATGSTDATKDVKVNTEKLRAKLVKTYPKYYRDLNATSPSNW